LKLPDPPLLVITDRRQAFLSLAEIVEAALAAGCRWISVREKDLPVDEQIRLAQQLRPMTRHVGAHLTLHGSIPFSDSIAATIDGVHFPDGADVSAAHLWRERGKLVGRSIHTVAQAKAADPGKLDYLVAGPAYESASKPGYGPSLGAGGFAKFARATSLPVVAIGGIDPVRVGSLRKAGAAGVAVMGGVMRAADPGREVRALIAALDEAEGYPRPR
jgi:thiamine-phosphate pyrophosphorylase